MTLQEALTAAIALGALRLIWVDFRQFEIELETLAVLFVLALIQSLLFLPFIETSVKLFAGLAFWLTMMFLNTYASNLARFGAGDPHIIGVIAFIVAPMVLPWATLSAVLIAVTAAADSIRRGKRLFKSMFPAAPPMMGAAMVIYLWP